MEMSTGNPIIDCLLVLGLGAGAGYLLKKKSPEQVAAMERQQIRQQELEAAQVEADRVKSANDATVALMAQKHDSYRKAAEGLGKSFHNNPNVNPSDAQVALAELAKNFGIIA